ncbi:hypothetical protein cypCar_00031151 [Cyprinus carpio]|nr:hypothetical protein cypCar_00031151 [Cyprinus carpio]
MKSNISRDVPPDLSDGAAVNSDSVGKKAVSSMTGTFPYCQSHTSPHDTETDLQLNSDQAMHDDLQKIKDKHKTSMKNKYESLFEGINLQENQTLLNRIYTQLYIIEGESEGCE